MHYIGVMSIVLSAKKLGLRGLDPSVIQNLLKMKKAG